MSRKVEALKAEVAKLPDSTFTKFANWVYKHASEREYAAQEDDTTGIALRDVLRVFKRDLPLTRGKLNIWEASIGGGSMADFFQKTRVKGCAFKNDADMLLAEWGPEKNSEFRLAYTRQLIPPSLNGEDQIWQLTLDMRFPMTSQLQKLGTGNRWFKSVREHEKILSFIYISKVGRVTDKMKPTRTLLSFQNIE